MTNTNIASTDRSGPKPRRRWLRRLAVALSIGVVLVVALFLLLTDPRPLVDAPPPPDAQQVAAARAAVVQLRAGQRDPAGVSTIRFSGAQFDAIGALASNGFRPDRLLIEARGDRIEISGSHRLPLGRWLNAGAVTTGRSTGFPPTYLTVGGVTLPPALSHAAFAVVRFVANLRGARIPPLDHIFVSTQVANGSLSARLRVPRDSNVLEQLSGRSTNDAPATLAAYCELARRQKAKPSDKLIDHIHRAFEPQREGAGSVGANRAAFMALAMLVVDSKVGELAGVKSADISRCRIPAVRAHLNGRADLPMHWALSAALAVGTGTQLSKAMGEWKELADSVSKLSEFAVGDPSGFSFIDLSADRSGFLIATAALDETTAASTAMRLATIPASDLLPRNLMALDEGLPADVFVRRYGSIDDPRFAAVTTAIDATLRRSIFR
ncbi:hypothetical protein [Sphingomonas sp. RS2018]